MPRQKVLNILSIVILVVSFREHSCGRDILGHIHASPLAPIAHYRHLASLSVLYDQIAPPFRHAGFIREPPKCRQREFCPTNFLSSAAINSEPYVDSYGTVL
jgi:hypothetical protein